MALHYLADSAFDDLLCAWRNHWRLRNASSTTISQLGRARIALDDARIRMNRIRTAMYPTEEERATTIVGALCPVLDEFVHLGWTHQFGAGSGQLLCPCGELVPVPRAGRLLG